MPNQAIVTLNPDRKKVEEAILYILQRAGPLSQYEIVKALFIADRHHLNTFGRPVTFDNYVAMEHGPVPSLAYDALKPSFDVEATVGEERPWVSIPDPLNGRVNLFSPSRMPQREYLSDTDVEALDRGLDIVRTLTFSQLRRVTHEDPAYLEAWERGGNASSAPMKLPLLIEEDGDERAAELAYISRNS